MTIFNETSRNFLKHYKNLMKFKLNLTKLPNNPNILTGLPIIQTSSGFSRNYENKLSRNRPQKVSKNWGSFPTKSPHFNQIFPRFQKTGKRKRKFPHFPKKSSNLYNFTANIITARKHYSIVIMFT